MPKRKSMGEVDGRILAELNDAGYSYTELGIMFDLTRNQVAGRIDRYKQEQAKSDNDVGETSTFEEGRDFINIICASRRLLNQNDLIDQFKIDTSIWEVVSYKVKSSEGYRKDRRVKWEVTNGTVTHGSVDDSGKMLVVPLYHLELRLTKKIKLSQAKDAIEVMVEDAKKFSPSYPKVTYKTKAGKHLYEVDIPDLHFGRLTWAEESGEDFDIKLAQAAVDSVVEQLIANAANYNIGKILLPLGNDFFNSDNKLNTTTHGTPQDEDTRWQKTFKRGRELAVSIIDRCSAVAPVDVLIVTGNHSEERTFYLGDALECWYHKNPNVSIDNSARKRKYYQFGNSLIGYAHGYSERLDGLPLVMAVEEPELWAKSKYREWHTGDKHHKDDKIHAAREINGVIVRILRALTPADAWTFSKGLVGAVRAAEAFMWDNDRGLVAQFTAMPILS